jgi:hypothetical protein
MTVEHPPPAEPSEAGLGAENVEKPTTLYPGNFKPAEIAHDVPLLASR